LNSCQIQIVENLILKVSEILNVPPTAIKEKSKKEAYCIARELVWVVCKNDLCISFRSVGEYFGRDHKTIRSGFLNMRDELEVNKERQIHYKELVNG
jgi:chromosomal replication initiation ATPase DnaA